MLVSDRIRKDLINSIKKQLIETAPCKSHSKTWDWAEDFCKDLHLRNLRIWIFLCIKILTEGIFYATFAHVPLRQPPAALQW